QAGHEYRHLVGPARQRERRRSPNRHRCRARRVSRGDTMTDVAIITGSAGQIGSATARRFAADGITPIVSDLDGDGAARVAHELTSDGLPAESCRLDVTSRESWDDVIASAQQVGRLAAVVNNAGVLRDRSLKKMD